MFTRTACPRAVRRRSCEPEGETCARKHEQIVADGEFVVVHRRFSGLRRDEPDRCRLRSRSHSCGRLRGHCTHQERSPVPGRPE